MIRLVLNLTLKSGQFSVVTFQLYDLAPSTENCEGKLKLDWTGEKEEKKLTLLIYFLWVSCGRAQT